MPGYTGFHGHHWHTPYYSTHVTGSPLDLAIPFLVLALLVILVGGGQWVGHRIEAFRSRRSRMAEAARSVVPYAGAVPAPPVLASDIERERSVGRLSQAIGEGRLSLDEGIQRIDTVLRSRHRHELEVLVSDLPAGSPERRNGLLHHPSLGRRVLAVAAALVIAAVLVQALAGLWALWPVAVACLGAAALLPRR